jgi:hypothetical protein
VRAIDRSTDGSIWPGQEWYAPSCLRLFDFMAERGIPEIARQSRFLAEIETKSQSFAELSTDFACWAIGKPQPVTAESSLR